MFWNKRLFFWNLVYSESTISFLKSITPKNRHHIRFPTKSLDNRGDQSISFRAKLIEKLKFKSFDNRGDQSIGFESLFRSAHTPFAHSKCLRKTRLRVCQWKHIFSSSVGSMLFCDSVTNSKMFCIRLPMRICSTSRPLRLIRLDTAARRMLRSSNLALNSSGVLVVTAGMFMQVFWTRRCWTLMDGCVNVHTWKCAATKLRTFIMIRVCHLCESERTSVDVRWFFLFENYFHLKLYKYIDRTFPISNNFV